MHSIDGQTWDVLIVGSGPAALIVALELARIDPETRILIVEYGKNGDPIANDLDESITLLNPANHHPPIECTNKGFGGTSQSWGGRCVSYDPIDFLPREIVGDNCTWDSSVFEDVRAFYGEAAEYLDCGTPIFNLHELKGIEQRPVAEGFVEGDWTDSTMERWSLPTRMNKKYQATISALPNVRLLEGARADSIAPANGNYTVRLTDRATGEQLNARAPKVVIAAGTQESTRLLLRSTALFEKRGGAPAALGKFYQGHISGKIASVEFSGDPKRTDYGFLRDNDGIYLRRRLQLTTEALLRENLLNTALWLDNPLYHDPSHGNGTMSFIYLMMSSPVIGKKLAPPAIAHSVVGDGSAGMRGHGRNIVGDLPTSLVEPVSIFSKRYLPHRKLPGVFLFNRKNEYALHFHAEQQPIERNRMELAPDGQSLVIDYHYTDDDVSSVVRTHQLLDEWLRKTGSGELRYWYPPNELPERIRSGSQDGIHQTGTIRMSETPARGVVDRNLEVWGAKGCYVCSSAVFPTSGQANPTFLLAAFAARLARHVKDSR